MVAELGGAGLGGAASGRMVLVVGEAGVGKSRLVRELSAVARDAGVAVFCGRAVPAGEPYRPLVEALSAALRGRPMPTDAALAPYLPVLAGLLPDAGIADRADPRGGVALGEAVLRLLTALGGPRGAVLVLEDLQWVDPDTLDVLRYLAHAAEAAPLVLLATARDEVDPPQALLDLAAASQAEVIPLRRLGDGDTRGVVEACLASRPPAELVRFVLEHADGLPFLVEELLTGLAAVGALAPDGQLTGPLATNVPRTFAATVRHRLADLDPRARAVVEAAAVLGRRFDWRLIPEITGLPEAVVLAALRAAVATGLVVVAPDAADTFRFRHALTCDAVRADLLPPEYRVIARSAAAAVERHDPDLCDLAAALWVTAGNRTRAAELYVFAGAQARLRGALQTAEALLTRAAELAADHPALRREAEVALLQALAAAGDTDRALELGERLLAGGEASVRLALAEVAADAGRWDVAAARLAEVPAGDDPRVTVLAARLAHAHGRPDEARSLADQALPAARVRGQWPVACQALEVIGRAARVSDLPTAREAFIAAEQLASEHDLPVERVSALHQLGTIDLLVDGSVRALERARELAVQTGALGMAATLDVQVAASLLHRDPPAALRHARRCAELAHRLRIDQLAATALFFQAAAYAHERDAEAMRRCVAAAERLAPDDLDVNAGIWGAVHAHVALIDDDRPALARCLDRAMDYLRRSATTTPAPTRGLWALVRTLDDRDGEAAREQACPYGVNWENRALLGYADAVAAGRAGRRQEADALLAAADTAMAPLVWWRHRLRLLVAPDALAAGWGDPVGWVREALAVFVRRGDDRLAARCRELLRQAGAPVPRRGRGDTPVPPLLRRCGVTSREMDVLQLLARGLSNPEIAGRLVLSPRTVETHVANLLTKTGAASRSGLAELVEPPDGPDQPTGRPEDSGLAGQPAHPGPPRQPDQPGYPGLGGQPPVPPAPADRRRGLNSVPARD
jgi:DNA-binding CsgD family transcriptional regulator/tetratricopeptide (TPR) repeat protein